MYPMSLRDRLAWFRASSMAKRAELALSAPVAMMLWESIWSPLRSTAFEVEAPISTPATITFSTSEP